MTNFCLEHLGNKKFCIPISYDEIVIGKLSCCDITIKDDTVSRKHCKLVKRKGYVHVVDLKSTNGTYINGRLIKHHLFTCNDILEVGKNRFKFVENRSDPKEKSIESVSRMIPLHPKEPEGESSYKRLLYFLENHIDLSLQLKSCTTRKEIVQRIAIAIWKIFKPQRVFFFTEERGKLERIFGMNFEEGEELDGSGVAKDMVMKAIKEKVAILSEDVMGAEDFNLSESAIIYGLKSFIIAPIWTKENIYGVIYIDSSRMPSSYFNKRDLEIMRIMANICGIFIESNNLSQELEEEVALRAKLEPYHSPAVVSKILAKDGEKYTLNKETFATVLFLDIVDFTSKVKNLNVKETGKYLNEFFTVMTKIVFEFNGTLDKYTGDGLMAVFGVPVEFEDHADLAVKAALKMMRTLNKINESLAPELETFLRIGINSGDLIAGNFGSPQRYDYTVLGHSVNIAAKLEAIAEDNEILISESTYKLIKEKFLCERKDFLRDKKGSQRVKVYSIIEEVSK